MSRVARPENDLLAHCQQSLPCWQQFYVDQHLRLVSPMASTLERSAALWNEMVTQHIVVLRMSYSSIRALSLGVDVLADLVVCTSHKLEAGYTMIRYAHVHMSNVTPFGSGNCATNPCCRCTPSASRFTHCMQPEILAVSDQDSAP